MSSYIFMLYKIGINDFLYSPPFPNAEPRFIEFFNQLPCSSLSYSSSESSFSYVSSISKSSLWILGGVIIRSSSMISILSFSTGGYQALASVIILGLPLNKF